MIDQEIRGGIGPCAGNDDYINDFKPTKVSLTVQLTDANAQHHEN